MNQRFTPLAAFLLSVLPLVACIDEGRQPLEPTRARVAQVGRDGAYDVGFTFYMIHDPARNNRPIPVYVWYPVEPSSITAATLPAQYPLEPFANVLPVATSLDFEQFGLGAAWQEPSAAHGPFPLVMYSPGLGAPAWGSGLFLATELVRHGFVFASVTHWGDAAAPVNVPGEPVDHIALAAYNRPRDISFTITDLLARSAAPAGPLSGVIDPSAIYASGWSLGGYAAMVLAAGDEGVCDLAPPGAPADACGPTPADPRIKGIMPLDGSNQLMHFAELARVRVPSLGMGEDWDAVGPWQARQHAAFSGSPNYRVDVSRTIHYNFADVCEMYEVLWKYGVTPKWGQFLYDVTCLPPRIPSAELHRIVNEYVLAFLTHQQPVLTPGFALGNEPDVGFFVTERRNPSSIPWDDPPLFIYFMHQPGRGNGDSGTATAQMDPTGLGPDAYGIRRANQ